MNFRGNKNKLQGTKYFVELIFQNRRNKETKRYSAERKNEL
jgi:hypothetical protein